MRTIVILLVVLLAIARQDFWFWEDGRLIFEFMPIGLAWHAGISIGASITWWLAVRYCWPTDLEAANPTAAATEEAAG